MKKLISLLSVFALTIQLIPGNTAIAASRRTAWDGTVASGYYAGDGTSGNPYQIANAGQLAYMASQVNGGYEQNQYYILVSDIDINYNEWTPIGEGSNPFIGYFDGNGHIVSNMNIGITPNRSSGYFTPDDRLEIANGLKTYRHRELSNLDIECTAIINDIVALYEETRRETEADAYDNNLVDYNDIGIDDEGDSNAISESDEVTNDESDSDITDEGDAYASNEDYSDVNNESNSDINAEESDEDHSDVNNISDEDIDDENSLNTNKKIDTDKNRVEDIESIISQIESTIDFSFESLLSTRSSSYVDVGGIAGIVWKYH